MQKPKKIYNALCDGEPLSDEAIAVGIEHFEQLAKLAVVSGPVFHLAFKEANETARTLRSIQEARARNNNSNKNDSKFLTR